MKSHCITCGSNGWEDEAYKLFSDHGFVVLQNVLEPHQYEAVLQDCKQAAEKIVQPEGVGDRGNRGPGRYSFGVASSTGGMFHLQSFSQHLLDGACSKLLPLLAHIFEGGVRSGFVCTGGGGDFVMGETSSDQGIHSDIVVGKAHDVWMPPPMLSVNFTVQDLTSMNGPIRMIPGTQLWRGIVPEPIPDQWERSCLCPVPAGSAIIRDVRVLHSGTRNVTQTTRYLPSIEFVSADFRSTGRNDCFPPYRILPNEFFEKMHPEVKKTCLEIVVAKGKDMPQSYTMS